jgi:hypothetical protein
LNKIETFQFSPIVRNALGQSRSTLDCTHEMARRHIVIANLAKGVIGETEAHLLGALLIARVQAAGLARLHLPDEERPDFHLILDEAHDFGTGAIPSLLSQARHYSVTLTLAPQFISALTEKTQAALLANPSTLVVFGVASPMRNCLHPNSTAPNKRSLHTPWWHNHGDRPRCAIVATMLTYSNCPRRLPVSAMRNSCATSRVGTTAPVSRR